MSDPGLDAQVTLDIQAALAAADDLGAALSAAVTGLTVEADATTVTSSIDEAVAAANTDVAVDGDATGVGTAIDEAVAGAEAIVDVQADTAAAQAEIGNLDALAPQIDVPVTADTSQVDSEVADAAARAEATDVVLTVTADTSAAEQEVGDLGAAAGDATTQVQGLGGATQNLGSQSGASLGEVAGLAGGVKLLQGAAATGSGSASALGTALGSISPAAFGAVAGVGAVVATLDSFFEAGVRVTESKERFASTFGDMAASIKDVDVGTLNGDLADLALELGNSTSTLRDAASNIGQFGAASGRAAPEVARTAEQVLALALRARALKPSLGDAGAIAERLTGALARGGRALVPFGIGLTAAEINARALADSGKATNLELTSFDKLAAGAAITAERLGDSLGQAVAAGGDKASIQLDRMGVVLSRIKAEAGEALVGPILGSLDALLPVAAGAATALAGIVTAIIPLIELVGDLGPALGIIGGAIGDLGGLIQILLSPLTELDPAIRQVIVGVALFGVAIAGALGPIGLLAGAVVGVITVVKGIQGIFEGGGAKARAFAEEVGQATDAMKDQAGNVQVTDAAVAKYIETTSRFNSNNQIDDLERLGLSLEGVAHFAKQGEAGIEGFVSALNRSDESNKNKVELAKSFEELVRVTQEAAHGALLLGNAQGELGASFIDTGDATGDYVTALENARAEQDRNAQATLNAAVASGALTVAQRDALTASVTGAGGIVDYSTALENYNAQQQLASERTAQFAADFGILAGTVPTVAAAYAGLSDGVGSVAGNFGTLAVSIGDAKVGTEELTVIATGLGVPVEALQKFVDGVNQSVTAFVQTAVESLPSVGQAFDDAAAVAKEAERPLSGTDIADALNKTVEAVRGYSANLTTILGSAYADLAGFAIQQGPAAVAAIAESLKDNDGKTLESIRGNLETALPQAYGEAAALAKTAAVPLLTVNGEIGTLMADTLGANFNPDEIIVADLGTAAAAVPGAGAPVVQSVTDVATQAHSGFGVGIGHIPQTAADAMEGAHKEIVGSADSIVNAGKTVGEGGGTAYGTGLTGTATDGTREAMKAAGIGVKDGGLGNEILARIAGSGVGRAFGAGIVQGIDSYVGAIRQAAAHAVNEAERAARDAADSHSPSRLFARLGFDLSRGIAEGIGDGTPQVVREAEQIVREAADAARSAAGDVRSLATADLRAVADTAQIRTTSLAARQLDLSAIDGSGGGTMTVQVGDVLVQFQGALPTAAEATAAGVAVADGLEKRLRERRLVVTSRGL